VYEHAVAAMVVAGALAAGAGWARYDLRLALLGGLLHDVGELYLDPAVIELPQAMSPQAFRHLSVHPSVGAMLLGSLTDYPTVLQRAVAEHHERLDGTGYPLRSLGPAQSGLGRLLCAVEVVAGILLSQPAPLARAALALRIVPAEFEPAWQAALARAARAADEPGDSSDAARLEQVDARLRNATQATQAACARPCTPALGKLLQQASHALSRLVVGWNSAGAWPVADAAEPAAGFEGAVLASEIDWRMRALARHVASAGSALHGGDALVVDQLCRQLEGPAA
jgi:hypothetical protein